MCDWIRDGILFTTVFANCASKFLIFISSRKHAIQQVNAVANHNMNDDNGAAHPVSDPVTESLVHVLETRLSVAAKL